MPFYYDVVRSVTTNASGGTESPHLYAKTIANQETVGISGVYMASRFGTAGGAIMRVKTNSGTTVSGGTAQTPFARNIRGSVAAQSTWFNDATAITVGTTLTNRVAIGFAQTGGMGGWVATEPSAKIQMMPNATNPVDIEFTSIATTASVTGDLTVEFSEGI
jgi:hypothetical protein